MGKACGNGTPMDFPGEPGALGECSIDFAEVYGGK